MFTSLHTTFALTALTCATFTTYTGFKLYSTKSQGHAAIKALLSLGKDIHTRFDNFYKFNSNLKNEMGIFAPDFKVAGQNIETYTKFFSYKNFETAIQNSIQSNNILLLRLKILKAFDAITKFSEESELFDFTNGNLCVKIIVHQLPKSDELIEQVDLIEKMTKADYSTTALAGITTLAAAAGYVARTDDNVEESL